MESIKPTKTSPHHAMIVREKELLKLRPVARYQMSLKVCIVFCPRETKIDGGQAEMQIDFLIPIDRATESKKFGSDTSWENFCYHVSGEIGVRKDDLNLAYKFSTAVQKELPKLLVKPIHFSAL